ncbi:MAG TPA: DUF72 domain-containing protein [Tepidisphaeraceae bacterium]|jgi:uncharacterized protein YecE (DUF72 family)|nr:DUF72 domain-containing protein [Tepidisphaeraceae bacterium]
MAEVRIGISGWRYGPWRGTFYPKDLQQRRELEFASCQLNSIEINGSFYSLQRPKNYLQWYQETPEDFVFAVKGSRFITHMKRLNDVKVPLANFLASGVLALREKLGPILWQFPPGFGFNEEKFENFFALLPKDTEEAVKLARRHDARVKGRCWLKVEENRKIRHAVEIRHESFATPAFVKLLRKYNFAFVFADTAGKWPYFEDVTSDFIYARLHGDEEIYVSGYTDSALDWWASRICKWKSGGEPEDRKTVLDARAKKRKSRDVFVYFDNDVKVRAPYDAMGLMARVCGQCPPMTPVHEVAEVARTNWPGFGIRK